MSAAALEPVPEPAPRPSPETRTDVTVAGYRLHKNSTTERPLLGSLLLGIYADDGRLQHVGVAASFTEAGRAELIDELEPLRLAEGESHPWSQWQDEAAAFGRRDLAGTDYVYL